MISQDLRIFTRDQGEDQLSQNFKAKEFFCKCGKCQNQLISMKLVSKLQLLRALCSRPIKINCGYRCEAHNKKVGGVLNSQHCKGTGADIVITDLLPEKVAIDAGHAGFDGIGIYKTFTHVDVRGFIARWEGK